MPTINFPSSPALDDLYSFGGKTWTYNGVGWALTGSASESRAALDVPSKAETTQAIASSGNVLLNGDFSISQEFGTSSTSITAGAALKYVVDGWYVAAPAGGNLTVQQVITDNKAKLVITGSAGNTGVILGSRVESADSYSMAGLFATLSLIVSSSSLTSVTWSLYYASTKDSFGTIAAPTRNLIDTGTLSGITSTEALKSAITSAALSASAHTGLELVITTGALLDTQTLTVVAAKLEKGAVGSPVFEQVCAALQLARCYRHYYKHSSSLRAWATSADVQREANFQFPVTMRVAPTITYGTWASGWATGPTTTVTKQNFYALGTVSSGIAGQVIWTNGFTADARL